MKRFKRITGAALAVILVIGAASCGSKKEDATNAPATNPPAAAATAAPENNSESNGGGADTQNDNSAETTAEQNETQEDPPPGEQYFYDGFEAKDLGGRTITFAATFEDFMGGMYRLEYPAEDAENYDDKVRQYENARRIEEKYNVKFESIQMPWDDISEQLATSVMANDAFADILRLEGSPLINVLSNNFAMPTSDYMPANADALNAQLVCAPGMELLGGVFYFQDKQRWGTNFNISFMGINQNIIASIGAPNPVDLYEAGQWTWDKWLEIAVMATKDTDGDGNLDQWGFSGPYSSPLVAFVNSNDAVIFDADSWKVMLNDSKVMNTLNFIEKFTHQEKLWWMGDPNDDQAMWQWTAMRDAYKDGKIATFYLEPWFTQSFMSEGPTFEFSAVPFPVGPDNKTGHSYYQLMPRGQVIPRSVKDPQFVYQIYEELMDWFGNDVSLVETEASMSNFLSGFPSYEDAERILEFQDIGGRLDLAETLIQSPLGGNLFGPIVNGSMTPAQAVEAGLEAMQERADEYLEDLE